MFNFAHQILLVRLLSLLVRDVRAMGKHKVEDMYKRRADIAAPPSAALKEKRSKADLYH